MKAINKAILIFLVLVSSILNVYAQNSAKVSFVLGSVKVMSSGQSKWKKAAYNMNINKGDRIQTSLNARIELKMPDGSVIKVNENSIFDITEIKVSKTEKKDEMSFSLFAGSIWAKFKKLVNSRQSRKIESPSAVVAIRGTELSMNITSQGGTGLTVIEGKVSFRSKSTGGEVMVTSGQKSTVFKGKSPTKPTMAGSGKSPSGGNAQGIFEVNVKKLQKDPAVLAAGAAISGRIPAGAGLTANGQPINVDAQGNFSGNVRVNEGLNDIKLTATFRSKSKSRNVKVYVNTKKPEIQFSTPVVSGFYNRRDYSLSGAVFDPTPQDKIKVFLNREMVVQVDGRGTFNRTIILKEGENIIRIRAVDLANNTTEISQKLFLDTVRPIITMTEPAQPVYIRFEPPPPPGENTDLSNQRFTQIIRGLIIDPQPSSGIKSVTINGQVVKPNVDGSFQMTITLRRGENRLNIVAEDLAGNIRRENNRIIRVQ
jgi:uncharacterized protein YfaP (DUF2135 family)